MPPQRAILFTKPVSRLLKAELQRLCQHFRIPAEGAVVALRNRLNTYLRLHADDLKNDADYAALYPRNRQRDETPPVNIQSDPPSPRSDSNSSDTLESDDDNPPWGGINNDQELNPDIPMNPSLSPEPDLNIEGEHDVNPMNPIVDVSPSPEPVHHPRLRVNRRSRSHSSHTNRTIFSDREPQSTLNTVTSSKRPLRNAGQQATDAGLLIAEHIIKKFRDGWDVHVPLTYLMDRYCSFARGDQTLSQDSLFLDGASGKILSTNKSLSPRGELELNFDEWIQAWHRLLSLIKTYLPQEYPNWHTHYLAILNNSTRASRWSLWLAYDTEIRRRSISEALDPSVHHLLIWNELESTYIAKKVKDDVSKSFPPSYRSNHMATNFRSNSSQNRPPDNGYAFRNQNPRDNNGNNSFRTDDQNSRRTRCIFCGDGSGSHLSRYCNRHTLVNGNPCHLCKASDSPTEPRRDKQGRTYCYSWNGYRGCQNQSNCSRGVHLCSLCGSQAHIAQICPTI